MPTLTITTHSGDTRTIAADSGASVMRAIRNAGIDEMSALCSGCCSCVTCHVLVDESQLDGRSPMSAGEDDLLDISEHRTARSRLSCQLPSLDGLRVTIAPEDRAKP
ncbi:ferredoxin [Sphingomonas sp. T9W2]|uniref:ferredoxin n=1 Tax=Sphingomonas sp. T9W2 TaxID=3143183 RepID=UPI0001BF68F3